MEWRLFWSRDVRFAIPTNPNLHVLHDVWSFFLKQTALDVTFSKSSSSPSRFVQFNYVEIQQSIHKQSAFCTQINIAWANCTLTGTALEKLKYLSMYWFRSTEMSLCMRCSLEHATNVIFLRTSGSLNICIEITLNGSLVFVTWISIKI